MYAFPLTDQYPADAGAIRIRVRTRPPGLPVDVYRTEADKRPIHMADYGETIMGRPDAPMLYAETPRRCESCRIEVLGWFL